MIEICNEYNNNKIVVAEENNRKFVINNKSCIYINKIEIDPCYMKTINEEQKKCDYLFEIIERQRVNKIFYIELKGSDINQSIKQLTATMQHFKKIHNNVKKECHIVASRYKAPSSGQKSQKTRSEFKRKNNIQLFIKSKIKEVTV